MLTLVRFVHPEKTTFPIETTLSGITTLMSLIQPSKALSPITLTLLPIVALVRPVQSLLGAGLEIHCLRDLTRGGLATALIELAESSRCGLAIEEAAIPVSEPVRGACEILGLDPSYVANEGRFVCVLPEAQAEAVLNLLSETVPECSPVRIGRVTATNPGLVSMKSLIGTERILDRLSGEQLPRIC